MRVVASFNSALDSLAPRRTSPPRPRPAPTTDPLSDAFTTLGVVATASHAEVKARYRALAFQWHPDRRAGAHDSGVRMTHINEAYAVVCKARGW